MFRIIPTAMHSLEDVEYTLNAFDQIAVNLKKGLYKGDEMQDKAID